MYGWQDQAKHVKNMLRFLGQPLYTPPRITNIALVHNFGIPKAPKYKISGVGGYVICCMAMEHGIIKPIQGNYLLKEDIQVS